MRKIDESINPQLLNKQSVGISENTGSNRNNIQQLEVTKENLDLLYQAERYFADMKDFYDRRKRVREYIRGNHWGDMIQDPDGGGVITEEDYIKNQGVVPLKQNLMRNIMKNLDGQYQSNPSKSVVIGTKKDKSKVGEMLTNTLFYANQINSGEYLRSALFNEFQMSGLPVAKVLYQYNDELERPDIKISMVDTRRIVFNTDISDPRMTDIYFITEIIDTPIEFVLKDFAANQAQEKIIRDVYNNADTRNQYDLTGLKPDVVDKLDFFTPTEVGKCRLYSVWYKQDVWGVLMHDPLDMQNGWSFDTETTMADVEMENANRRLIAIANGIPDEEVTLIEAQEHKSNIWKYKFLTPNGYCLKEGVTPFEHGESPYVIFGYPMIDGQIWGPLEDIVDQQKLINRYITTLDMMNSSGAKGNWLIPEESKPDDMTKSEYVDEIRKVGGVVWLKPDRNNPNPRMPNQKFSNFTSTGLIEMLNISMKMMQDISGVQPSIQGQRAPSGTPASLFAQEVANSATNVLGMMNAFNQFIKKLDTKVIKTIIQFYTEKRVLNVSGNEYRGETSEFDPEMVDGFDFDLIVAAGNNTPAYRQVMDDMLYNLLQSQAINISQFLENTSLPFADKLLESINQQQQAIQQGGEIPQVPQDVVDGLQSAANPQAMELLNRGLKLY